MNKLFTFIMLWMMSCLPTLAQAPMDGGVWKDNTGKHINAHGGNIFNYKGTYFLGKWCSGVEKTIKNTVALLVSNLIFIYLQLLS